MNPVQRQINEQEQKSKQVDDSGMLNYVARDDWSPKATDNKPANRLPSRTICQDYHDFMTLREVKSTVDPDEEIPFTVDWLK